MHWDAREHCAERDGLARISFLLHCFYFTFCWALRRREASDPGFGTDPLMRTHIQLIFRVTCFRETSKKGIISVSGLGKRTSYVAAWSLYSIRTFPKVTTFRVLVEAMIQAGFSFRVERKQIHHGRLATSRLIINSTSSILAAHQDRLPPAPPSASAT